MLVKDIQAINELDTKITDLIEQLNNLIDRRLEIVTKFARPHGEAFGDNGSADFDIDLDSIDLSLS